MSRAADCRGHAADRGSGIAHLRCTKHGAFTSGEWHIGPAVVSCAGPWTPLASAPRPRITRVGRPAYPRGPHRRRGAGVRADARRPPARPGHRAGAAGAGLRPVRRLGARGRPRAGDAPAGDRGGPRCRRAGGGSRRKLGDARTGVGPLPGGRRWAAPSTGWTAPRPCAGSIGVVEPDGAVRALQRRDRRPAGECGRLKAWSAVVERYSADDRRAGRATVPGVAGPRGRAARLAVPDVERAGFLGTAHHSRWSCWSTAHCRCPPPPSSRLGARADTMVGELRAVLAPFAATGPLAARVHRVDGRSSPVRPGSRLRLTRRPGRGPRAAPCGRCRRESDAGS